MYYDYEKYLVEETDATINNKNKKTDKDSSYKEEISNGRFRAEGNISSISSAMKSIDRLLKAAFEIDISFEREYVANTINLPCITYTIVERENSDKTPLAPIKICSYKEVVDGKYTGDVFNVFTKFYDCMIEFDIYGINGEQVDYIKEKFEEILEIHSGALKKAGLSDIRFLKEISAKDSINFETKPGAALVYYIEIQKVTSVRTNVLKKVNVEVKTKVEEDNPLLQEIIKEIVNSNDINN